MCSSGPSLCWLHSYTYDCIDTCVTQQRCDCRGMQDTNSVLIIRRVHARQTRSLEEADECVHIHETATLCSLPA